MIGLIIVFLVTPSNPANTPALPHPPIGWTPSPDEDVLAVRQIPTADKYLFIQPGDVGRVIQTAEGMAEVYFEFGDHWVHFEDLTPRGTSSTPTPSRDMDVELRKLAKLRDDGLLTEDEFQAEKRKLLDA